MTLTGAVLGCSGGGAHPIILDEVPYQSGGSETGGGPGGASEQTGGTLATGGTVETGGTGAVAGQEPGTGGMPGTGGASETGGSRETGGSSEGGGRGEGGGGETAGSTGTGGWGGELGECPLMPNDQGTVAASSNICGIQGSWYEYSDCTHPDDPNVCSTVIEPQPGSFPNTDGVMCTSGSTVTLAAEGDRATKWGAGIGLKLNQAPESAFEGSIRDLPVTIVGFRFTVSVRNDVLLPQDFIVNFRTPDNVNKTDLVELSDSPGSQRVMFSEAHPPTWATNPAPFDPRQVVAIQFLVQSQVGEAIPFDYCISDLTALYQPRE
ncbi:MAG: hypothetical protein JW940_01670 [Polyangiaceae bacterium]|nr:hypothetical protein [Polyangiaceae bacterium]